MLGDKDPQSCPKEKRGSSVQPRAPLETVKHYRQDSAQFTALKNASPTKADAAWEEGKNGQGFAIVQKVRGVRLAVWILLLTVLQFGLFPGHGMYVAGYVSITYKDYELEDKCGQFPSAHASSRVKTTNDQQARKQSTATTNANTTPTSWI